MLNLYNNVNLKNHLQYLSGQKHGLIRLETLLKYLLSSLPICGVQSLAFETPQLPQKLQGCV